jgi:elongation factor Ts
MATTTAQMVKELREQTGAGMMDCKKCLDEAGGDLEKAVELVRKAGLARGGKQASREAKEGLLAWKAAPDGSVITVVQMSAGTDFATRNPEYRTLLNDIAAVAFEIGSDRLTAESPGSGPALLTAPFKATTVGEAVQSLAGKISENIQLTRVVRFSGTIGWYIHHDAKQGAVVLLGGVSGAAAQELGKDVAMHAVFAKPTYLDRADVPAEVVAKEREIAEALVKNDPKMQGKPAQVLEKIAVGRVDKFYADKCLREQPYYRDNAKTVTQVVKEKAATVEAFSRFEVGVL